MSKNVLMSSTPDMLGVGRYSKDIRQCGEYDCHILDVPGLSNNHIGLYCATDRIVAAGGECVPYYGIPGKGRISRALSMHWYLQSANYFHRRSHFSSDTLREVMGPEAFEEYGDRCILCRVMGSSERALSTYVISDPSETAASTLDEPLIAQEVIHKFINGVLEECAKVNVGISFPLSLDLVHTDDGYFLSPLVLGFDRCHYTISGATLGLSSLRSKSVEDIGKLLEVQPHVLQAIAFECEFVYKLLSTKNPNYGMFSGEIPFSLMRVGKIKQDYA